MGKYKYRMCSGLAMAPEKDMRMLARMSRKGWHFAGMKGVFEYKFEKGEPHNYQYALNMEMETTPEMLELYEKSGWKPIVAVPGAQIFRAEEGTAPIFSDASSEIEMLSANRKWCGKWAFVCGLLLIGFFVLGSVPGIPLIRMAAQMLGLVCMVGFVFTFLPVLGYSRSIYKKKRR